jgi:hypothetical protein
LLLTQRQHVTFSTPCQDIEPLLRLLAPHCSSLPLVP